jgi:FRG domain
MADAVMVEHPFTQPEDFLAALRPSAKPWTTDPTSWVYRGHADSTWRLLPSQNRRASLARHFGAKYGGDGPYCQPEPSDLGALMVEFVHALNRAGYRVPAPDRFDLDQVAEKVKGGQPDAHTHEVIALAQHHELPTYMLDWTRYATIAAYFAASEIANLQGELKGQIEVWGLHKTMIQNAGQGGQVPVPRHDGSTQTIPAKLHVSAPPLRANPNLHAQGGLFTFITHPNLPAGVLLDTAMVVEAMAAPNRFSEPAMHRLTLPQSKAGELLFLLSHDRVTGAAMFPGYGGVVRDVRDRMHYPNGIRERVLRLNIPV